MRTKPKTLVIDIHTNQVVDVLDIDITNSDAKFILQLWLTQLVDWKKDPKKHSLPDQFKDKLGLLANWPAVTYAVEIPVNHKQPLWYSKVLADMAHEEKRLLAKAFSKSTQPA